MSLAGISCACGLAKVGLLLCLTVATGAFAQGAVNGPRHQTAPFAGVTSFNAILGRPTNTSITISALSYHRDAVVNVHYGVQGSVERIISPRFALHKGEPLLIVLDNLQAASRYAYQIRGVDGEVLTGGVFSTQKLPGQAFTFTVTADSHLDQNTDLSLYQRTLLQAQSDRPDFHIDLGDTFMTEKHEGREGAARQYLAQRYYFGQIAHEVPLYLVVGNHDGEEVRQLKGGQESLGVWANSMRKRYFPNPVPNQFYTGDTVEDPYAGAVQDYYAWQWGDALFVVLNPYWHAPRQRSPERWNLSLGDTQYEWLKQTLASSKARFKLVFVHQLIGGSDRQGRGGAEGVAFGEWGGSNVDGSNGMAAHRPGWDVPIHQLLSRYKVSAVLHGHDHLFAHQERDGIVYQEVPQPGHGGANTSRDAEQYGYKSGTVLGNSGYLRITVAPDHVKVDFLGVPAESDARQGSAMHQVLHSYNIPAVTH